MSEGGSGDAGTGRERGRCRGSPKTPSQSQLASQAAGVSPRPGTGVDNSHSSSKSLRKPLPDTNDRLRSLLRNSGAGDVIQQEASPKSAANVTSPVAPTETVSAISVAKSTLSVNAEVFVPRSMKSPPQNTNFSNMPGNLQQRVNNGAAADPGFDHNSYAINHLQYTLDMLKTNPGSFDELMAPLAKILGDCITVVEALEDLVKIVFEQAIGALNFQYMGARICSYLSSNINFANFPRATEYSFRTRLLQMCQKENANSEAYLRSNKGERVRGFTMFMAELFLNMIVNGCYIQVLIKPIHQLLDSLLSHPSDENFKCVAKVLKLSGAALEDSGEPGNMEALLSKIKDKQNCPGVKKHIIEMLLSILTLRSSNWGRSESPVTVRDDSYNFVNSTDVYQQPDPVFYNAQGQTISRQEAGFADGYYSFTVGNEEYTPWSNPDELYYDGYIDGAYDPEMDDEMEEAFERFVLETEAKRHGGGI